MPADSPLLELPPELLLHILSLLPVRALLRFSITSRAAHSLSLSSLHTLNFGVYPSRISSIISRLAANPLPAPTVTNSAFFNNGVLPNSQSFLESMPSRANSIQAKSLLADTNIVSTIIPEASLLDYDTIFTFQNLLHRSVLSRYHQSLRNLDVCLWTLDKSTASTLRSLTNLRTLSIRVEDPSTRQVGRSRVAQRRVEERAAWSGLTSAWSRLTALRIVGAEIGAEQIAEILAGNTDLRELWLWRCPQLGSNIWEVLASNEILCVKLDVLSMYLCEVDLDEHTVDQISTLKALKYLALFGCTTSSPALIGHIPELIVPKQPAVSGGAPEVIEVDPAFENLEADDALRPGMSSTSAVVEAAA